MVRHEVIRRRIDRLNQYLGYLEGLAEYDFNSWGSDPILIGSSERYLHLSIEALIDIGNHLIADLDLGRVQQYRDIPVCLAEKKILTENQKKIFIRMIGFRNTLVHDYVEIDHQIVYDILKNHIEDFNSIKVCFAAYM